MDIYLIDNKGVAFLYKMAHNDGKFKAIRASVTEYHSPFRVFQEEGLLPYGLYVRTARKGPMGRHGQIKSNR